MKITIDTDILDSVGINANELVVLYKIHEGLRIYLDDTTIDNLRYKGLILCSNNDFSLTSNALKLIGKRKNEKEVWENGFIEFWNTYPVMADKRVLRTKESTTKQALECRTKYRKTCYEDIENIPKVLKGLKLYIASLKGKESYIQGVEPFCNQFTWEKYHDITLPTFGIERTNRI